RTTLAGQRLSSCSGCLQNNSEQPLLVETSEIGTERLGHADQGNLTRNGLRKGPKAPIGIDLVNDDCALRSQGWPSPIQFETNVTRTMQAIVNEEINLMVAIEEGGACSNP